MPDMPPVFRSGSSRTASQREAERNQRRGTAHQRGYTYRLRQQMAAFKLKHPLCLGCQAMGRVAPTEVTDHVIPPKGDLALLWSQANWQPACRPHHDVVKQRLEVMFERGTVSEQALRLDSATALLLSLDLLR